MRKLFSVVLLCAAVVALNATEYEVASPDGKVRAKVICDKGTSYTLSCNGLVLIEDCLTGQYGVRQKSARRPVKVLMSL